MADDKNLPSDEELNNPSGQEGGDNKTDPDKKTDQEPETISLKKDEYDKLVKERDDYRTRAIAKDEKDKKPKGEPAGEPDKKEGDFLTKSDFYKHNESVAIKMAEGDTKVDPEGFGITAEELADIQADVKANFEDVKKFYSPKSGKDTPEDILNDLLDAHAAWRRRNPKKSDADKDARANLGKDRGLRGGSPGSKLPQQERRPIKTSVPPSQWYKTDK